MKKLFTLVAVIATSLSLTAAEKIVWTGDEPISWNPDVYAGSQFETAADLFDGIAKGDTIKVSVVAHIDEPQYVITYKAGTDWTWTDLTSLSIEEGLMSYIVESETIAIEIATRGLIFRGQGYNITQIAFTYEEKEEPEPQPSDSIDYTGLVETVVYAPESPIAISWDESSFPGTKIDTRNIDELMFVGLQEGHIIRVTIAEAAEDAEFSLQYKAGDDWTWTDLSINTATPGYLAYVIESDEMAMLIADRGLVIQGIRYSISAISVFGPESLPDPQGIETITNDQLPMTTKILRDGQLFILRDGVTYTVQGQVVR